MTSRDRRSDRARNVRLPPSDVDETLRSWTWTATALVFQLGVVNGVLLYLWYEGGEYLLHSRLFGYEPLRGLLVGLVAGVGLAALARIPPLRSLWVAVVTLASPPSVGGRLLLCASAAIAEEMLFRGVLLHDLGLGWSTVLYALAHVPAERPLARWPFVALGVGLACGLLVTWTDTLVSAVVASFLFEASGRLSVSPSTTSTGSAT